MTEYITLDELAQELGTTRDELLEFDYTLHRDTEVIPREDADFIREAWINTARELAELEEE